MGEQFTCGQLRVEIARLKAELEEAHTDVSLSIAAAIRKEAGEMAHDDIPEDLQQSYPCECGGNIVKKRCRVGM